MRCLFDETTGTAAGCTGNRSACPMDAACGFFGVPATEGLPNTRAGAEEAERRAIQRVLETGKPRPELVPRRRCPP